MRKATRGVVGRAVLVMVMALTAVAASATSNHDATMEGSDHVVVPAPPEGSLKEFSTPLVIPGADWRTDGTDPDGYYFWWGNGGITGTASTYPCIMAPVYFPQGETANGFYVTFVDNDATHDMSVSLRQLNHYTGTMTLISTLSSSGQSANPQNVSESVTFTSSSSYTYYLTSCLPASSSVRVINARIWY